MPSETSFCLPEVAMPNSLAALIALTRSEPAFERAITLAPEFWSLQQEGGEVARVQRMADGAEDSSAERRHHLGSVALELMAEGVVDGDEEPAVAALFDDLSGRVVRGRISVPGVMQA